MKYSPRVTFLLFNVVLILMSCQGEQRTDKDYVNTPPQTPVSNDSAYTPPTNKPGIEEDYINTDRVIWQKPDMILNLLGDLENKTVADIGAGTGFFAMRIAQKAKKVIAIDIEQQFIDYLDSIKMLELPEQFQPRLETRLAKPDDPNLRPGEADMVIIVNTFMYIKDRVGYLRLLKNGISEGGKLIIVDFKRKRTPIGPPSEIRLPIHVVEEALYDAGYRNINTNDTALDYQYIVMAQK